MADKTSSSRDDFEYWLASMDDFLAEFVADFPKEGRQQLDFSPESLEIVEAWILENYQDTEDMLASTESQRVNRIACYVGETFRRVLGGKWDINSDDPSNAFYSMPIILFEKSVECPLSLVTASADRRTGEYLRGVLKHLSSRSTS